MRTASVLCCVVFLLCLVALPIIDYAGGRSGTPFFPAAPLGIGLVAGIILVFTLIRSFLVRRHRLWPVGGLAIVVAATLVFGHLAPRLPGFLHGLRDRFEMKVGYPKMREFAEEVSQMGPETMIARLGTWKPPTAEDQKRWDDLVARYPFLNWNHATGTVLVRGGIVELTWGSALVGHWGFRVAPGGEAKDPEEDRCRILRASEDILFINYFD